MAMSNWILIKILKQRRHNLQNTGYDMSTLRGYDECMKLVEEHMIRNDHHNVRVVNYELREKNKKLENVLNDLKGAYRTAAGNRIENENLVRKNKAHLRRLKLLKEMYPDIYDEINELTADQVRNDRKNGKQK